MNPATLLPILIGPTLLISPLKTNPPTPPSLRFWQQNAPLQSSAVTVAFQVVRYAANLGFTMALARLLAPGDFGVFGMALTFTGLLLLFKDGGVESAMLSHGPIVEEELASLGSLNALYGLTLALVCAALGPLLARLYGEPSLTLALLLPAGAFLFHGLDVVPGALLLRAGKFRLHAAIELIALLAARREIGIHAEKATEPSGLGQRANHRDDAAAIKMVAEVVQHLR